MAENARESGTPKHADDYCQMCRRFLWRCACRRLP